MYSSRIQTMIIIIYTLCKSYGLVTAFCSQPNIVIAEVLLIQIKQQSKPLNYNC